MIVTSIQRVVHYVDDNYQTRVYKTIQDPVTRKEIIACEIYTSRGVVVPDDKGTQVDKKV